MSGNESRDDSSTDARLLQPPSTSGSAARTPPEVRERKGGKAAARLYHKKSRTGCQRCRARRVKVRKSSQVVRGVPVRSIPRRSSIYNVQSSVISGLSIAADPYTPPKTHLLIYAMFDSVMKSIPCVEAASGINFHATMTAALSIPRVEQSMNPLNPMRLLLFMIAAQILSTTQNRRSGAYWSSDCYINTLRKRV